MTGSIETSIAVNQFEIGARPGELDTAANNPKAWLERQTGDKQAFRIKAKGLVSTRTAAEALSVYLDEQREKNANKKSLSPDAQVAAILKPLKALRDIAADEIEARANHGLMTQDGFSERLALFWSNHFTISATKALTIPFAGVFEREVVRDRMTGTFEDMLLASTRHPGMLLYLDQAQSIGPNSPAGERRGKGLNENLAREILELHTLGAQGGYTQADVTGFAKALTGWSMVGERTKRFAPGSEAGDFLFVQRFHEPGVRTVLGNTYAQKDEGQAEEILRDLARHPATAKRIAHKLAKHFISDDPPATAADALERSFRQTGGSLPQLHETLIALTDAWRPEPQKFKSPNEFMMSALRLAGLPKVEPKALVYAHELLGQPAYRAPSPEGWPDDAASWAGPDAVIKRIEWSQALSDRLGTSVRPEALAKSALGASLSAKTIQTISRAESAAQGLTLVLMSPEFQRR